MKICIIYHSYSGITRGVAEKIRTACGGDLVEVTPRDKYSTLTAYTLGCMRARKEECDPIEPGTIDVSPYGLIVIGTPGLLYTSYAADERSRVALGGRTIN